MSALHNDTMFLYLNGAPEPVRVERGSLQAGANGSSKVYCRNESRWYELGYMEYEDMNCIDFETGVMVYEEI